MLRETGSNADSPQYKDAKDRLADDPTKRTDGIEKVLSGQIDDLGIAKGRNAMDLHELSKSKSRMERQL